MCQIFHKLFFPFSGDWHSAYVLLYAPRILEVDVEEDEEKMET